MKKHRFKTWILLSVIVVLASLSVSCSQSRNHDATTEYTEEEYDNDFDFEDTETYEDTEQEAEDVEFDEYEFVHTDNDGYKYSVTIKITPWAILSGNENYLNSAWNEVSAGSVLPGYDDWGLDNGIRDLDRYLDSGKTSSKFLETSMTDMYYSVGSIEVKNITEGWDITEDSIRSPAILLDVYMDGERPNSHFCRAIGRIFYSSEYVDQANGVYIRPKMTSNYWGAAPFIIMSPEALTPNDPDGAHLQRMLEGYITLPDEDFSHIQLGVINKNSEYLEPENGNED